MTDIEKLEMARYYEWLEDDVRHIVKKYSRIMGWEVPELDEEKGMKLIFEAMHHALARVEGSYKTKRE